MHHQTESLGVSNTTAALSRVLARFSGDRLGRFLYVLIAVAAILNAWLYSAFSSTPLVQADGWYFIDSFLPKYFDGSLTFADLFVQRGSGDHAQPIQKLILLFHTRYFDMDFRIEGLIGIAFGTLLCWFVASQMKGDASTPLRKLISAVLMAAVFAVGLSINSNNIFTWPLVTLGFIALLFVCIFFAVFFWAIKKNQLLALLFAALTLGVIVDEIAIVAVCAAIAAALAAGLAPVRRLAFVSAHAIAGLALARFALWLLSDVEPIAGANAQPNAFSFAALITDPGIWKAAAIPLSSSLIHNEHWARWLPGQADSAQTAAWLVAALVALLHLYFWATVVVLRRKGQGTAQIALAVGIMLTSYALTLGIVVFRVPLLGWDYLHQPRYVLFYQQGLIAILVLMHQRVTSGAPTAFLNARIEAAAVVLVTFALLTTQVCLARSSWRVTPYLTASWQTTSFALGQMAANPDVFSTQCPATYDHWLCRYKPVVRATMLKTLKSRQLNIFSPAFQARNRLYPYKAGIAGLSDAVEK